MFDSPSSEIRINGIKNGVKTLEITHVSIHCFAITGNVLEIRYPDDCNVQVARKARYNRFARKLWRILIPEYDQWNAPLNFQNLYIDPYCECWWNVEMSFLHVSSWIVTCSRPTRAKLFDNFYLFVKHGSIFDSGETTHLPLP